MKAQSLFLLFCLLPAALLPDTTGNSTQAISVSRVADTFPVGEDLVYEVNWLFIKLGTVRIRVMDVGRNSTAAGVRARADIDSYPGIPFVSLHVTTETIMDSGWYSEFFLGKTRDEDIWRTVRYSYANERHLLFAERGIVSSRDSGQFSVKTIDTLRIEPPTQDGLSLLYFARANLRSGQRIVVPTAIESSLGRTIFDFPGKRSDTEIDAVDYPIDVIEFSGIAEFEGIMGLTGEFEGWVSNDDARVPISANVKVLLGSVNVELIEWHHGGWIPPRYR